MNCDLAGHLIDDYLDDRLRQSDRQHLEQHISLCPRCAGELRDRLAFERGVRQALTASVQNLQLAPGIGKGILRTVESGAQQTTWSHPALRVTQALAGLLVIGLLLLGLSLLLGGVSMPMEVGQVVFQPGSRPVLSVNRGDIFVEPQHIQPGDLFTVTVAMRGDQFQPRETVLCNLDIEGPSGSYRFELSLQSPLPTRGRSVLRVTPDILAVASQKQYGLLPADILSEPGVYSFRVTLFSPDVSPSQ